MTRAPGSDLKPVDLVDDVERTLEALRQAAIETYRRHKRVRFLSVRYEQRRRRLESEVGDPGSHLYAARKSSRPLSASLAAAV